MLFQAQISVPRARNLIFVKTTLVLILSIQSMLLTPYNSMEPIVLKGVPMALKIVYQICCGIDVHKTFVFACIASSTNMVLPPTSAIVSQPSHKG